MAAKPLSAEQLYHACDFGDMEFQTTDDLTPDTSAIGQERAVDAIRFGIGIGHGGYNLFISGSSGIGKHLLVARIVGEEASRGAIPCDWCYVNNFDEPHQPRAMKLPRGQGHQLRRDMLQLIENLLARIPATFKSDDYRSRVQELQAEFEAEEEKGFQELGEKAHSQQISLLRTPHGYTLGPVRDGKLLTPEQFSKLPPEEQEAIKQQIEALNEELTETVKQVPKLQQRSLERLRDLEREFTHLIIDPEIQQLRERYRDHPAVQQFLDQVHQDLIENIDDFMPDEKNGSHPPLHKLARSPEFRRYRIKVLVGKSCEAGAPVILEDMPSYQNLIGRIEYSAHFGTLSTDFTMIQPGALHRANGGYLIIDARKLLSLPFAWEGLKRALRNREIRIDPLEKLYGSVATRSLEPEPIPLDVKVLLIGDRRLYYLLKAYDPDFTSLFKVYADFAEELDRESENLRRYIGLISALCQEEQLRPLTRDGVARVVEQSSRYVDDSTRLSLHRGRIVDLLREADYWSRQRHGGAIEAGDVERAVTAARHRNGQYAELMLRQMERGTLMVDTDGSVVGQGNGLSVIQMGDERFGRPSRISATARIGSGKMVDIERETELGGAIHSKGVLILSSFLASRFARNAPLSLNASLVFEQSYGPVDGDSASALELCVLLSAIAGIGLRQQFAVTGSVNQHGHIQAIGGVNEKIEGFYELCASRGLTGEQGVIIPAANIEHLTLQRDIVEACDAGRFHVYAVSEIDELLALLTGETVGEMDCDGLYPPRTLNGRVQRQLQDWYDTARKLNAGDRS
ncbi:ATP-dependent protease [Marinobacterium nitratireducens]|uniref:endopeptidase La n=1 Tax=Marinobacterium nitratireducens TaxID=518897 RepID=A0A917ZM13_9GAMM|nr:ATP-binding protein [Marinobacterium nitratireducens]GGO86752.1 ATP-dependent protease [Marinobacterium nitratireducens]